MRPYTASMPRYRAVGVVIRPEQDGIYKTRAARLLDALKGRWSHRQRGYVVSETKAVKFARLYAAGYDATIISRELIAPEKKEIIQ